MGDLSIVINEKINLKLIKDNPQYLLFYEDNFFLSTIGKSLFETYKKIYFDKQMELTDQNILLYGNEICNYITDDIIEKINKISYNLIKFDDYYQKLKTDFVKADINNNIIKDIIIEGQSKNDLDVYNVKKIINKLQNSLTVLENKKDIYLTPEQMLNKYEYDLKQRLDGEIFSIGCSYLDKKILLGARPGLITTIFAATGISKSSFSLYLDNKRLNKCIPSLHLSLENDNFLTTERLLCMRFRNDIRNLYDTEDGIHEELQYFLEAERKKLQKTNKYLFVEESGLSIADVETLIIEAKKIMGVNYLVCTIDLASMLRDFGTEADQIERSMNRLHTIARVQNIHFILVIQANRTTDSAKIRDPDDLNNLRPNLNNIKNSNAIAERSRVVLGLYRRMHYLKQYFPDDPRVEIEDDILDVMILKQNSGPLSLLHYLYIPECSYFVPFTNNKEEI